MYPIYCVNLENRIDRKIHSINEFNKINILLDNVKYPHFIKDPRGGIYGCFDSHMKIWNDFYKNYPNEKYCLIFEDDFELVTNEFIDKEETLVKPPGEIFSNEVLNKIIKFIDKNYIDIDILNLHDHYYIDVNSYLNNDLLIKGYGGSTHAYFVTRHYIHSIITKYGDLPIPNGMHLDFSINFHRENKLYTENIFFTRNKCFNQMISKTDNNLNVFVLLRYINININILNNIAKKISVSCKRMFNLTDSNVKYIVNVIYKILCI